MNWKERWKIPFKQYIGQHSPQKGTFWIIFLLIHPRHVFLHDIQEENAVDLLQHIFLKDAKLIPSLPSNVLAWAK